MSRLQISAITVPAVRIPSMKEGPRQKITRPEGDTDRDFNRLRRTLLRWIPASIFTAIAATFAAAGAGFLRPRAGETGDDNWASVAPVAELSGAQPVMRKVAIERRAGWSRTHVEQSVFVFPQQNNRVVSATCPHEGCEVTWRGEAQEFFCPCHDSRFNSQGAVLSGPARDPLYELPTRVENGVLQIRHEPDAQGADHT